MACSNAASPVSPNAGIPGSGAAGPSGETLKIAAPAWHDELYALAPRGHEITSFDDFVAALADRRAFFRGMGATATEGGREGHGVGKGDRLRQSGNPHGEAGPGPVLGEGDDRDAVLGGIGDQFAAHVRFSRGFGRNVRILARGRAS